MQLQSLRRRIKVDAAFSSFGYLVCVRACVCVCQLNGFHSDALECVNVFFLTNVHFVLIILKKHFWRTSGCWSWKERSFFSAMHYKCHNVKIAMKIPLTIPTLNNFCFEIRNPISTNKQSTRFWNGKMFYIQFNLADKRRSILFYSIRMHIFIFNSTNSIRHCVRVHSFHLNK